MTLDNGDLVDPADLSQADIDRLVANSTVVDDEYLAHRRAALNVDPDRVKGYADKVMAMVIDDVRDGVVPWTVTDFSQLHDWVDANMYLEQAGQQFDAGDPASIAETNAITDAVSKRLADGEVTGGEWFTVTWTSTVRHAKVLPWRLLQPSLDGELRTFMVDADELDEFESRDTLLEGGERICIGLASAAPLPYTEPADRYGAASILDDPRLLLRQAVVKLRDLDAEAKRLETEGFCDGFENEQDEKQYEADQQARKALRMALKLLGMGPAPADGRAADVTFAEVKAAANGSHLCDEECGDETHPRDGRVTVQQ